MINLQKYTQEHCTIKTIEIEIDKGYPHELTPEDVQNILKQLDAVGLDVNKLIENFKINNTAKRL